jgi:hypothetical protein
VAIVPTEEVVEAQEAEPVENGGSVGEAPQADVGPPSLGAVEPSEVLLSVMAERPNPDRPSNERADAPAEKPDAAAQTFLQELKSFWVEPEEVRGPELTEVRFSQAFWDGLDKLERDLDEAGRRDEAKTQLSAEAAAGVSISLTAGFVSWALRAGSMAASFLAAMPTWRNFDPMPVLAHEEEKDVAQPDDDDPEAQEDEVVEQYFEN